MNFFSFFSQIGDASFWAELVAKSKNAAETESEDSELPPLDDVETNIHSFGILLLEIISGKLSCSEGQGNLVNWVSIYYKKKSPHILRTHIYIYIYGQYLIIKIT